MKKFIKILVRSLIAIIVKKVIRVSLLVLISSSGFAQTYVVKQDVQDDINAKIVPNSTRSITAAQMNKILNGLWDFNVDSIYFSHDTLNYRRGGIWFLKKLPATGVASSGLTSLNSLTGSTQLFAVGESGADFNISSSGSTHTFNLPFASATHAGKLSSEDWIRFNAVAVQSNSYVDSVITALYNITIHVDDTTGRWMDQQVLLDTVVLDQDSIIHAFYTDGSETRDTIKGLVTSTNIYSLVDTARDTIFVDSQVLNGDTLLRATTFDDNDNATLHFRMDSADATHDGYMTKYQWSLLGTGGSPANGSETIVTAGINVTVPGAGTSGNPYIVNADTTSGNTKLATQGDITNAINAIPPGGANIPVNDSIATGFRIADSSVVSSLGDPTDLTWTKVSSTRKFELIDNNFIHYRSAYEINITKGDTAIVGTAPSAATGKLVMTDTVFYQTETGPPVAPWVTVELDISSMGSTSSIGPALIKDATHYVLCRYVATGAVNIIVNGTGLLSHSVTLNPNNLILYMVINGRMISFWANSDSKLVFLGTVQNSTDLRVDGALAGYKYGIISSQPDAATCTVNSLRAGACGGTGLLNVRSVVNEDGSPYTYGGKSLFTADYTNISALSDGYRDENSVLFALDNTNFSVDILGRLFFKRRDVSSATVKIYGGADINLVWFSSQKKWLMVYTQVDGEYPYKNNQYAWLDYEVPFGENVIDRSQLNYFGYDTVANPKFLYDVSVRKINGTFYVLGTERTLPASDMHPVLYSGPSLTNLPTATRATVSDVYEGGSFIKLGGTWYVMYWSWGETKATVYNFPSLTTVGDLNLPATGSTVNISFSDWLPVQKNGKTEYYLVGFDSSNITITDQISTSSYEWTRGNLVVWKANETSTGYEFPTRIANQISFPSYKPKKSYFNTIPYASETVPGIVSLNTQTLGSGAKTFVTSPLTLQHNQNGETNLLVANTNANAASGSKLSLQNNAGTAKIELYSSLTTAGGLGDPNSLKIANPGGGGIAINADSINAPIKFTAGGSERMRIFGATGNTSIGNTTDNGYKLDVTGTGRVSVSLTSAYMTMDSGVVGGHFLSPTFKGSNASGGNMTLQSTGHATKGKILFGTGSAYDQANDRWGMGTQSPGSPLTIVKSQNAETVASISNTSATSAAAASWSISTNAGTSKFGAYSTTNSFAIIGNGMGYLYNDAASGGLAFLAQGASSTIRWGQVGVEYMRMTAGKLFVGGSTTATAKLHLAAGTATANTAPLKFESGTNLTTAETGAVEYNGTNLFFTRTGTTRESIMTANAVNSVSPTAPNRTITVVIDGTTYYIHAKTTND